MAELQQGQRVKIGDPSSIELRVELGAGDLEIARHAVVLLNGRIGTDPVGLLYPGETSLADGAASLLPGGTQYRLNLGALSGKVERALLIVWIVEPARQLAKALSNLQTLAVSAKDGSGTDLGRFAPDLSKLGRDAAAFFVEVYDKGGTWRLKADGSGFLGGLPSMANRLAIEPDHARRLQTGAGPAGAPSLQAGGGAGAAEMLPVQLPSGYPGGVTPPLPAGLTKAVGFVSMKLATGEEATATAFAITPGGCLVTCQHVVDGATELRVMFEGASQPRRAEVIAADESLDVALIKLADANGCEHWLRLAAPDDVPTIGTEVALLGYPLGAMMGTEISYSQGIINSVRQSHGLPLYQSDCGSARGASGGPLFRRSDGAVLGVHGAGITGQGISMNINLAISVASLSALSWVRT